MNKNETEMPMKCSECSTVRYTNDLFCPVCGTQLIVYAPEKLGSKEELDSQQMFEILSDKIDTLNDVILQFVNKEMLKKIIVNKPHDENVDKFKKVYDSEKEVIQNLVTRPERKRKYKSTGDDYSTIMKNAAKLLHKNKELNRTHVLKKFLNRPIGGSDHKLLDRYLDQLERGVQMTRPFSKKKSAYKCLTNTRSARMIVINNESKRLQDKYGMRMDVALKEAWDKFKKGHLNEQFEYQKTKTIRNAVSHADTIDNIPKRKYSRRNFVWTDDEISLLQKYCEALNHNDFDESQNVISKLVKNGRTRSAIHNKLCSLRPIYGYNLEKYEPKQKKINDDDEESEYENVVREHKPYMIRQKPPKISGGIIQEAFKKFQQHIKSDDFPLVEHVKDKYLDVFKNQIKRVIQDGIIYTYVDAETIEILNKKSYQEFVLSFMARSEDVSKYFDVQNKFKIRFGTGYPEIRYE